MEYTDYFVTKGTVAELEKGLESSQKSSAMHAGEGLWAFVSSSYAEELSKRFPWLLRVYDAEQSAWGFELFIAGKRVGAAEYGENAEWGIEPGDNGFTGSLKTTATALATTPARLQDCLHAKGVARFCELACFTHFYMLYFDEGMPPGLTVHGEAAREPAKKLTKKISRRKRRRKAKPANPRKLIMEAWNALGRRADDRWDVVEAAIRVKPKPKKSDSFYTDWLGLMNNAVSICVREGDVERAASLADLARPHVTKNHNLAHNLACAYALVGRDDDAFAMCEAAVAIGYTNLWQLPTDEDLGKVRKEKRFKDLMKGAKAKRKKPTPPPSWGYGVFGTKSRIKPHEPPPLLDELAYWLRYQPHGSVGLDCFEYRRIGLEWQEAFASEQRKAGFVFFTLGEGSDICLFDIGEARPVVLLGGEGEIRLLAPDLESYLLGWAKRDTGIAELDEDHHEISRREHLEGWLAFQGVTRRKRLSKKLEARFDQWRTGGRKDKGSAAG